MAQVPVWPAPSGRSTLLPTIVQVLVENKPAALTLAAFATALLLAGSRYWHALAAVRTEWAGSGDCKAARHFAGWLPLLR